MAQVIYGDDLQFRAVAYGRPHPGTLEMLANQFNPANPNSMVNQVLHTAAPAFLERARAMFEEFNGEDAMRLANAAIRRVSTMWGSDTIRPLTTIADFQHAPSTMVRWIMATPEVRELYHAQRLDGYSDFYKDLQPDAIGEHHYDYRRVMDGIVVMRDQIGNGPDAVEWHADTYVEDLIDGDAELTLPEQMDIMDAMRNVAWHLRNSKDDPTSKFNAELG